MSSIGQKLLTSFLLALNLIVCLLERPRHMVKVNNQFPNLVFGTWFQTNFIVPIWNLVGSTSKTLLIRRIKSSGQWRNWQTLKWTMSTKSAFSRSRLIRLTLEFHIRNDAPTVTAAYVTFSITIRFQYFESSQDGSSRYERLKFLYSLFDIWFSRCCHHSLVILGSTPLFG